MTDRARRYWVGVLDIGDGPEFVRIGAADDGSVLADLPDRGRFNRPGEHSTLADGKPEVQFEVNDGHCITLAGTQSREPAGADDGVRFRLWPTVRADPDGYGRHVGDVCTDGGRTISFHLDSDEFFGEPMFIYAEGDRIVRLHPVGMGEYLSEDGELFTLSGSPSLVPEALTRPEVREQLRSAPAWSEEPVTYASTDTRIGGTVLKPAGSGPFPAVVLVHGSGGGRRDLYRIFGALFARAGIAALIYDKRGHGESGAGTGPSSIAARADDAEAGLQFLRSLPYVDPERVGLWGFSNGGWSVPMVTARRRDVAFAIVVGAPGVSPLESEIFRKTFEMTEIGVPAEDIQLAVRAWRLIYDYAVTASLSTSAAAELDELLRAVAGSSALTSMPIQQYAVDDPMLSPVPPYATHRDLPPLPEPDRDLGYDPWVDYTRTRCAVLVLAGERDANQPAESSGRRITGALAEGGNDRHESRIFPGAGHMINLVDESEIDGITTEELSYRFERFVFAPGFRSAMTTWAADDSHRSGASGPR